MKFVPLTKITNIEEKKEKIIKRKNILKYDPFQFFNMLFKATKTEITKKSVQNNVAAAVEFLLLIFFIIKLCVNNKQQTS